MFFYYLLLPTYCTFYLFFCVYVCVYVFAIVVFVQLSFFLQPLKMFLSCIPIIFTRNISANIRILLPGVVLWPNIPQKKLGIRMLPPMSEPMPTTEPAAAIRLASPPQAGIEEKNGEREGRDELVDPTCLPCPKSRILDVFFSKGSSLLWVKCFQVRVRSAWN